MTAREAYEFARKKHRIPASTNGFGSRFAEMHDAGILDVAGKRICKHTGQMASVWRLNPGTPNRRPSPRKLKLFVYLKGSEPTRVTLTEEPLSPGETECILVSEVPGRRIARAANVPVGIPNTGGATQPTASAVGSNATSTGKGRRPTAPKNPAILDDILCSLLREQDNARRNCRPGELPVAARQ